MEKQIEKIQRFSNVIDILLTVAFVIFIIVLAGEALVWLWSVLQLHTITTTINGQEMEFPLLFKLGDVNVALPVAWEAGLARSGLWGSVPVVSVTDILGAAFTIVGLKHAKVVFKLLRDNGSPFREEIVKGMKKLAIVLLIMGFVMGVVPFLAAGITWVLCLIFDYGRALQDESDTTL